MPHEARPAHPGVDLDVERAPDRGPGLECVEVADDRAEGVARRGRRGARQHRGEDHHRAGDARSSQPGPFLDRGHAVTPWLDRFEGMGHGNRAETVPIGLDHREQGAASELRNPGGVPDQSLEIDVEDFDLTPFVGEGGLAKAAQVFGRELGAIVRELNEALAFGTGHLSLYQLTIEPGTRFATLAAKGDLLIPDGDTAADLFDATQAVTRAAGLPRYEVSNHAKPGEESRHNLTYWRYGDYAGIGPGAHGRRLAQATERHRKPENFISAVGRDGHGLKVEADLPAHERATEAMLMGLRLTEGVDLARVEARSGLGREAFVDEGAVERLSGQGLLVRNGDRLAVTDDGILLLDSILSEAVRTS